MLANRYYPQEKHTDEEMPLLVFVHGFLGSGEDWQQTLKLLPEFPRLTCDLPGHGGSRNEACDNFDEVCSNILVLVKNTCAEQHRKDYPVVLIGYSLGARIVMYGICHSTFDNLSLKHAFIESGNFGLVDEVEKRSRWLSDLNWAKRFRYEPIRDVLQDWYQQSVFNSLNDDQRQELINKRSLNKGYSVSDMLLSTSLAKQPYLLHILKESNVPLHYICGIKDKKFLQLAFASHLPLMAVSKAGHNVHAEAPDEFAKLVRNKLESSKSASGDLNRTERT